MLILVLVSIERALNVQCLEGFDYVETDFR